MRLSAIDIKKGINKGSITVDPLFPNAIQPATVDLHLGRHFLVFEASNLKSLDLTKPMEEHMRKVTLDENHPEFVLHPHKFALGITHELIGTDLGHCCKIDGISSIARAGIFVHITASNINPGHKLHVTLELFNALEVPVALHWGMPIAQMEFYQLKTPLTKNDVYKGNFSTVSKQSPTASQYFKNYLPEKSEWIKFMCKIHGINPITFERT